MVEKQKPENGLKPKDYPKLVHRRENRHSTIMSGRTIGEAREKLETANERRAARKKDERKKVLRIIFTLIGFAILSIVLIIFLNSFFKKEEGNAEEIVQDDNLSITIEVIDENAVSTANKITSRMNSFIALVEKDFRDLNYKPIKAVIPSGSIREVDFYLEEYPGYIKTIIDRGSAVTVEDADRMMRYLASNNINEYEYIDVRIDGKAYWK